MARPRKIVNEIKQGDVVELWSQSNCEGNLLGIGVVDQIMPMAGGQENMIWVRGFAPHAQDAVKRLGSAPELVGQLNMLRRENEQLSADLAETKDKLTKEQKEVESLRGSMDKAMAFLFVTDGNDFLDTKNVIKWIKDMRAKFSLSAIREIGSFASKD